LYEDRCEYGAAEQHYQRSVRIMEQTVDSGDMDIERLRVQSWSCLGAIHRTQGRYQQAGELFRRALSSAEQSFGPNSEETANVLNQLGMLGKYEGHFEEAAQYYHRALAILEQLFGADHHCLASLYHNLGGLEHARGRCAEGEPFARRSV